MSPSGAATRTAHLAIGAFALLGLLGPLEAARADGYTVIPDEFIYCTTCHGVELQGNRAVQAPRLNGMESWYVRGQLEAFRRGWRGHHEQDPAGLEMAPQAAHLDEQGVNAAAEFVASIQRRAPPEPTVEGNSRRGEQLYVLCASCHGADGQGNASFDAPALAGQSDWYLKRALHNYQQGIRGTISEDVPGTQMRAAAMALTEDEAIDDVVAYINTLR